MKIGIGIVIGLLVLAGGYYLFTQSTVSEDAAETEVGTETGTLVPDTVADDSEATGVVREFVVEGGMFYFSPETIEVDEGDTVRITYRNAEGTHDWVLDEFDARTSILGPGEEETVEFVASASGEYEYYCSVGSHRQMGMVGTLIVN